MVTPDRPGSHSSGDTKRLRELARVLADRLRLARWGEDRPGETDARPPAQPAQGPGGAEYRHDAVRSRICGEGALACWVFEPSAPTPPTAPLIVFLHGWGASDPAGCGAWIDHLVKRGNLVIFPVYQDSLRTPAHTMLANVVAATKNMILQQQRKEEAVRPDLKRVAFVGHSLGGTLAAQLAAIARRDRLPLPGAVMSVAPGRGGFGSRQLPWVDLNTIFSATLVLVVVGEDDQNAGDVTGKAIYAGIPQVSMRNKNFIILRSDYHGTPPLVANHRSPGAANPAYRIADTRGKAHPVLQGLLHRDLPPVDAMDYYGYWKLFDGLTDAAFYGCNRIYALGDTPQQRFMGTWSDGVPVKEPRVITDPRMLW